MQPDPLRGPLCTRSSLTNDLQNLGLKRGDTILVHSSLSKIGWINGGAEALTQSFLDVLTSQGTLVVPTQTSSNSDPARWIAPPVPEEWWQTIRDTRPAYDPRTTRTERMGALAETVRTWPGAVRSVHPQTSFGAVGAKAEFVTEGHALDSMLGENSPLARLEDLDAKVLLLGVGFGSCTCFHLAEYRTEMPKADTSFAVMEDGARKWKTVSDVSVNEEDFAELGDDFLKTGSVRKGKVGAADCYLFSLSEAVRFAEKWLIYHRCRRT
ncbi:spbc2 prophage-derived aminoglycoside n(3)-acetyltransferase-like protein yokd [Fusarium avenaceum]|nr:spbc2 prophage-derived aminoglycoside n(3)-acetyltransferase-like protein yokd [Fusarium avenaceum]